MNHYAIRKIIDKSMRTLSYIALIVALIPLFSILGEVILKGASSINVNFFTQPSPTVGEAGGGAANAIQGTLITIGLASSIGIPLGLVSGIFLSEYSEAKISSPIRFFNDVLSGFPSIVVGIFCYALLVRAIGFSVTAAAFALAIIMIPIVTRTTEEAMKLVPATVREAAIALGVSRWRTIISVVLSDARKGVATGMLLALARIAGESAPVLVTMGYWRWWFAGLNQPVASLTLNIYIFAISPFENWQALAWSSALVLVMIILGINIIVRAATREKYK
jgi:phosphate transport system permease protein